MQKQHFVSFAKSQWLTSLLRPNVHWCKFGSILSGGKIMFGRLLSRINYNVKVDFSIFDFTFNYFSVKINFVSKLNFVNAEPNI